MAKSRVGKVSSLACACLRIGRGVPQKGFNRCPFVFCAVPPRNKQEGEGNKCRVTPSASGRRPDTRPSHSPPLEARGATTKRHRHDQPKPSEEAHFTQARAVEIVDLSGSNRINLGCTTSDRSNEAAGPKAFRAGNGPLTVGHAGGRGGRGNSKDRRKERRRAKQGSQARPNVASVAKVVCFYSPHENDVTSTGGGAHYGAPPVVRQTYHQDRPRTYSEAAGGQLEGTAPSGVATRYTHYSQP
jgi:hypothetical protein